MRPFTFLAMASSAEIRARLEALNQTGLLDSPPEQDFDRLTRLTCHLLKVPVALVSLVAQNRQFFKSSQGLPEPWASMRQTPLSFSFCQHVVNRREPLIITDARNNSLVCDNLAVSELGVIGYLGIPLVTPENYVIGSLCAIDNQPRVWSEADISNLTDLAALTIKEIELRFHLDRLRQTEHDLRQRTQELEQTNQELEQFTRIASHDLANPLNTILGFSELLQRGYESQLDAGGRKLLNALIRNSQKMKVLLQDLLAYARSGHTSFEKTPINLKTLIADTLENLESKITENQAVIQYEQLPVILGDSTYLRLLLQNLIENAIKYRRETNPHIRISASQDSKWCQIQVRDNGIGIEKQYLQSIFEPFRRVNASYRHAGSGIGLATSKRIVEQHGGKIWAESELGKGSVFHIMLPAIETNHIQDCSNEAT
jgi:signal transduction histidine kinase